jgi:hypothetical protein
MTQIPKAVGKIRKKPVCTREILRVSGTGGSPPLEVKKEKIKRTVGNTA